VLDDVPFRPHKGERCRVEVLPAAPGVGADQQAGICPPQARHNVREGIEKPGEDDRLPDSVSTGNEAVLKDLEKLRHLGGLAGEVMKVLEHALEMFPFPQKVLGGPVLEDRLHHLRVVIAFFKKVIRIPTLRFVQGCPFVEVQGCLDPLDAAADRLANGVETRGKSQPKETEIKPDGAPPSCIPLPGHLPGQFPAVGLELLVDHPFLPGEGDPGQWQDLPLGEHPVQPAPVAVDLEQGAGVPEHGPGKRGGRKDEAKHPFAVRPPGHSPVFQPVPHRNSYATVQDRFLDELPVLGVQHPEGQDHSSEEFPLFLREVPAVHHVAKRIVKDHGEARVELEGPSTAGELQKIAHFHGVHLHGCRRGQKKALGFSAQLTLNDAMDVSVSRVRPGSLMGVLPSRVMGFVQEHNVEGRSPPEVGLPIVPCEQAR